MIRLRIVNLVSNHIKFKITPRHFSVLCSDCYSNRQTVLRPTYSKPKQPTRQISFESFVESYTRVISSVANSKAAAVAKEGLIFVHDTTGLPWWATILLTTAGLRLFVTFPLSLYQHYLLAKLQLLKIDFNEIVTQLKRETTIAIQTHELTEAQAKSAYYQSLKKHWRLAIERENCHPLKTTIVFWFQLPMWVLFSVSLRNMAFMWTGNPADAKLVALEMSAGGVLWAPNLLVPDPTFILPVSMFLINLVIIEIQASTKKSDPSRFQKIITNVFRGFTMVGFPIACIVPSCMSFYWTASSSLALVQNLALMSPSVRRTFGIPKTPSDSEQPYRDAWGVFKKRWWIS